MPVPNIVYKKLLLLAFSNLKLVCSLLIFRWKIRSELIITFNTRKRWHSLKKTALIKYDFKKRKNQINS